MTEQKMAAGQAFVFFSDGLATFTRSNGETYDSIGWNAHMTMVKLTRIVVLQDGYNIENVMVSPQEELTVTQ